MRKLAQVALAVIAIVAPRIARADEPTVIAEQAKQMPHDLCVDGAYAYWTDRAGGAVWRVATKGGDSERIADGLTQPRWIVAGGGGVFVSTDDDVVRIDEKTKETVRVAELDERDLPQLAIDRPARALFVAKLGGHVHRVDLPRMKDTELTDDLQGALAIAVGGKDVFLATDDDHAVWRLARDGRLATRIATLSRSSLVLALDARRVYVADGDALVAIPRGGGAAITIVADAGEVDSLELAGGVLYWTDMAAGTVRAAAISDGVVHVLARDRSRPIAIRADAHAIYWIDWTLGGGPMRVVSLARLK